MTIYCCDCHTYCGEIREGSKIRKGLKYVCNECHEKRKGRDIPDFLSGLCRGKR